MVGKSDERYKKGSYIVTSGDIVTEASKEFARLINYEESDLVGKDVNVVFKTIRIRGLDTLTQPNTSIETFVFTKELMVRFVEITYVDLGASGGKVYFIEEIPNSRLEDKFPFFYKLLSDNRSGLAVYSANEFVLLQTNQFYLDFLDSPFNNRENTIGLRRSEIFKCWTGSQLEVIFNNVVATGETHNESEFMNLNFFERGTTYWQFSLTPFSENGKVKYIFFYVNDVTETVRTKQTLRRQKEEIKAIMDNISDAIIVMNGQGKYIHFNEVAKKFLSGINLGSVGDMKSHVNVVDANHNILSDEQLPFLRALRGNPVKDELFIVKDKNRDIYLNVNAVPIYEGNEINMVIGCCTDITEHIRHEEVMRKQQEMLLEAEKEKNNILTNSIKMKDEFLSLMSHEFKTPLNVILSAIQAMECFCQEELSSKATKYLKMIRQNSYRQLRLVNNLLDITRVSTGYMKVNKSNRDIVLITSIITESVRLFAEQKGIMIYYSSTVPELKAGIDEEKYERILLNLLSNAIKFTPKGKNIYVRLSCSEGMLRVDVADEGMGIPEDKQEVIFERFGQVDSSLSRQAEGTGIGLFLVKRLVDVLGGQITLISKEGKGSTFTLSFSMEKLAEIEIEERQSNLIDERLIGAVATEFSDIYF